MSRVLVTGAAGRIGRAVVRLLAEQGRAVNALVIDDPGDLEAGRVVVGDATDPAAVDAALAGADAVIHLAAIPSPLHDPPAVVFGSNTLATFTVLEQAGQAGVGRAMIASSYSATGLPFAEAELHPAYVPVDENLPDQAADPYALAKQADELTAAMMARRHGMTVVALRYPYVGTVEQLRLRSAEFTREPKLGARELWSYLDMRDAARAAVLAVDSPDAGAHVVNVAAQETLVPYPTEDLIRDYHPSTELRRPLPGRVSPIDTSAAERLLGFTAHHVLSSDQEVSDQRHAVNRTGWRRRRR
jgi:nucleoside-diphosphate-sugar epimerase